MEVREKMVLNRKAKGLTMKDMAERCRISEALVDMVESGQVTHPTIAERMKNEYDLTELETEELIPLNRRSHSGFYNPNQYVSPETTFNRTGGGL